MKKQMIVMSLALGLLSLPAVAGVTDSAGTWEGTGVVFNLDGTALADYTAELVSTAVGAHELHTQITVKMTDGTVMHFSQDAKDSDRGYSLDSPEMGHGGGLCLGEGICTTYVGTQDGHGYAQTLVQDGPAAKRVLRTELGNGKAVRLFREKYVKLN